MAKVIEAFRSQTAQNVLAFLPQEEPENHIQAQLQANRFLWALNNATMLLGGREKEFAERRHSLLLRDSADSQDDGRVSIIRKVIVREHLRYTITSDLDRLIIMNGDVQDELLTLPMGPLFISADGLRKGKQFTPHTVYIQTWQSDNTTIPEKDRKTVHRLAWARDLHMFMPELSLKELQISVKEKGENLSEEVKRRFQTIDGLVREANAAYYPMPLEFSSINSVTPVT